MTEDNNEGSDFVDMVRDNLPEVMSETQIIRLLGGVIASYCDGPTDAMRCMVALTQSLREHYKAVAAAGEVECDCPKCTAARSVVR